MKRTGPPCGGLLESRALGPEADDDRARLDPLERLEEETDSLLLAQLADVDDGRSFTGEELLQPLGVALIRIALPDAGRVAAGLLEEPRQRLVPRFRPERVDVDARRDDADPLQVLARADDVLEHTPDVLRAGEDVARAAEALPRPGRQLLVPADGELELRPVRLDGERHAGGDPDRRTEEDVVHEQEVRRQVLAHRGGVPLDPFVALGNSDLRQEARLQALVAVEDEDRQQAARVGPDERRSAQVDALWMRLLGEDDHLVPEAAPGPRERARVHVRAGPAEEVAVPDENLHGDGS